MTENDRKSFQIYVPARVRDALERAARAEGVTMTTMAGRWLEQSLAAPLRLEGGKSELLVRGTTVRVWPSPAVRKALEARANEGGRTLSMECRLRLEAMAKSTPKETTTVFMKDLKDLLQRHGLVSADGKVMW